MLDPVEAGGVSSHHGVTRESSSFNILSRTFFPEMFYLDQPGPACFPPDALWVVAFMNVLVPRTKRQDFLLFHTKSTKRVSEDVRPVERLRVADKM